jgi:hypothetical protein
MNNFISETFSVKNKQKNKKVKKNKSENNQLRLKKK